MNYQPEYVEQIAISINENLEESIHTIQDISERTSVLVINGRIEAARSGSKGAGFRIVANEFSLLNSEIADIATNMKERISEEVQRLIQISDGMAKQVRGQRLSQIALSIMDVIDRNLYERTCDVRWWATDSSLVNALRENGEGELTFAAKRLGVILDSYTVYLDLFLVDNEGVIMANGRPVRHDVRKKRVTDNTWFKDLSVVQSGSEFSFQSTHSNSHVNDRSVLVYGCRVYDEVDHNPLGALGIYFNWESLVDAVIGRVINIDLKEDIDILKIPTTICIVDRKGIILASTARETEGSALNIPQINAILPLKETGYLILDTQEGFQIISYGYSPGFETYETGWFCIIIQDIQTS